ncbi:MAG: DsbA family protein, partial [Polyangiaceae bacterium]
WGGGGGVTDPEHVAAIATRAGLDGPAAVKEANEPAAKDRVRTETERAIELGIFGVPTVTVDDESFWGVDSLPHLDAYLRGQDPAAGMLEKWLNLPVGAQRKGS